MQKLKKYPNLIVLIFIFWYDTYIIKNEYQERDLIMKKLWKQMLMLFATLALMLSAVVPSAMAATSSSSSSESTSSSATATSSTSGDKLAEIKQKGVLVVGLSADYPPLEFTAKINGKTEYVGVDVSIAKAIAKDLGVKLEIKNMSFDSLLVAMETGKVDMVISGMNATAERKKSVDFSHVYYKGGSIFLINKKDKSKFKSGKDLKSANIGVQTGSVQNTMAKNNFPDATVKPLSNLSNLVLALKSGKTNAVLMDALIAKAYANNDDTLTTVSKTGITNDLSDAGTAVAMPKGQTSLVNAVNQTIDRINANNTVDKTYLPEASKYMKKVEAKRTLWNYWTYFAKGIGDTLIITVVSVFFGFVLGIILSLMRLSKIKVLHWIAVCYIEFVRGTPLMVQIMFIYFGIGTVISSMPAILAGIIAISLNSGAYVAEIIRSGIQSIPKGQSEAARSLGLSQKMTFQYVIMPQALKNIWPALGNEFITLLKDSSLASTIGVAELMYQTQLVQTSTYKGVAPLAITMVLYFIMTFTVSKILGYYEGKMNHNG